MEDSAKKTPQSFRRDAFFKIVVKLLSLTVARRAQRFFGGAKFTALAPFFEHFVLSVDPSSSANYRRIYE
jgi:hypothetical protein